MTVNAQGKAQLRVRIFVDFWNFSLSINRIDQAFRVDWSRLGNVLTNVAGELIDKSVQPVYEGTHVYGSWDPNKPADAKFRGWFNNTLDKMPGVNCVLLPRQRKRNYVICPHCHTETRTCHSCNQDIRGTEEKGVDTRIATDMVSLAWAESYTAAVLLSADKDFVPVAEFLQTKGIKVIHGAFPPNGSHLSQKCWGNIDVPSLMHEFTR